MNGIPGERVIGVGAVEYGLNETGDWSIGGDRTTDLHDLEGDENFRRLHGELADFAIFKNELGRDSINNIRNFGVPQPIEPAFHLDFAVANRSDLADVSGFDLPITVGASVTTIAGGGPKLSGGLQLNAARWAGTDDRENEIRILDNPTLDRISQRPGSIVSWIRVEDETEWNNILLTPCDDDAESRIDCDQYSRTRGLEFQANSQSGVFGAVQGWNTNNFGPAHPTHGGPGGSETPTDTWTHVALTWNAAGDHTIYVNGVKGQTIKGVELQEFGLNDPNDWSIGGDNVRDFFQGDPNDRRLRGDLADFAIYAVEVQATDLQDIITLGVEQTSNAPGVQRGIQQFSSFGTAPSIVGNRIIYEDHLGRVQLTEIGGDASPLIGLNTQATQLQPIADGQSISYDGASVAFAGQLDQNQQDSEQRSGVFLVNQFGAFEQVADETDRINDQPLFAGQTFEVHSISDGLVVFGVRQPDDTDVPTGRILERGINTTGIFVAESAGPEVLVDTDDIVPDTNDQRFTSFGDARSDASFVFQAEFDGGFGIYERRLNGPITKMVDHVDGVPGAVTLQQIGSFAFSNGQLVFHGVTDRGEGLYYVEEGEVEVVADFATRIPSDSGNFASFGQVAIDKGNAVFLGRGRASEESRKQGLHEQLGIYASLNGDLEKVVDLQPHGQPAIFAGRTPVELSIGPEAISGDRIVFYAAFSDGTDGIFSVEFNAQSKHVVAISPGSIVKGLDFGRTSLPGEIRGVSFLDDNGDGELNPGERGTSGWTIYLDENDNGRRDTTEPSTTTGDAGEYAFTELPALRSYSVRQITQDRFSSNSHFDVELNANEVRAGQNFANREVQTIDGQSSVGTIRGTVFGDQDGNGQRDDNETIVSDQRIYIDANRNGQLDNGEFATTQDLDGTYEFTDLPLGAYSIRLVETDRQTSPLEYGLNSQPEERPGIGDGPTASVVGYFDDDSDLDLVLANETSNQLSFISNFADPDSRATLLETGGDGPGSVISEDFNSDGQLDLAVVNFYSVDISVLLGQGGDAFDAPTLYSAGDNTGPFAIASLHLDADAHPDLVISNSFTDNLTLLRNLGNGEFEVISKPTMAGDKPLGIVSGDFGSDGHDDVVVALQRENAIRLLENTGDNTLLPHAPIAVENSPSAIVKADFDNDGNLDVAVANVTSNSITVLFGTGDHSFERQTNIQLDTDPIDLSIVDFDNDGDMDLAYARIGTPPVSLLRNDGTGHFGAAPFGGAADFRGGGNAVSIATADVDNNGTIDLILANRQTGTLTFVTNTINVGSHNVLLSTSERDQQVSFGVKVNAAPTRLPGDANLDRSVTFSDFLIVSANFGATDAVWADGDFNADGMVGFPDFLALSANFGSSL